MKKLIETESQFASKVDPGYERFILITVFIITVRPFRWATQQIWVNNFFVSNRYLIFVCFQAYHTKNFFSTIYVQKIVCGATFYSAVLYKQVYCTYFIFCLLQEDALTFPILD